MNRKDELIAKGLKYEALVENIENRSKGSRPVIIDKNQFEKDMTEYDWKCPVCGVGTIETAPCANYCRTCGTKMDWEGL